MEHYYRLIVRVSDELLEELMEDHAVDDGESAVAVEATTVGLICEEIEDITEDG